MADKAASNGPDDLLTVEEAAAELGMRPESVRTAIAQGRLPVARRVGKRLILLSRAAVREYGAKPRRPGRPRQTQSTETPAP